MPRSRWWPHLSYVDGCRVLRGSHQVERGEPALLTQAEQRAVTDEAKRKVQEDAGAHSPLRI
jgi:hypothetical protein